MAELSTKLHRALCTPAGDCATGAPDLGADDLARLRRLLEREEAPPEPIDRKRAVNLLARAAPGTGTVATLERVLTADDEPLEVQYAAVAALGRQPAAAAEPVLRAQIGRSAGRLQREAVKALGRVGTPASRPALTALIDTAEPRTARAARFAATLIAFRAGDAQAADRAALTALGVDWERAAEPPAGTPRGAPASAAPLPDADRARLLERAIGSRFGLALADGPGLAFNCGEDRYYLLLDQSIRPGHLVEDLRGRPREGGLVYLSVGPDLPESVSFVVLTTPSADGLDVAVTRTTGEPMYAGTARLAGSALDFALRDVEPRAEALTLTGRVAADGLSLALQRFEVAGRRVRSGEAVAV